jgi:UDPglucose 6-dehydrogenase
MNICVVGTGYVGLVTGACFAEFGLRVTCVDKDQAKIEALKNGAIPVYEPGLEEMVKKNLREGRLIFSTDLGLAVENSLVIFIAVGTPSREDGSADLSYVEAVAEGIAQHLNGYKVIVTKSTVPVGTGERLREIIGGVRKEMVDFDVASNPEFLREGSAIEDFMRPNRVVIGAESPQAIAIMKDLYRPLYLIETPFIITDIPTAEMIKYASNTFLATKVSFINEIANLCELMGADVHQVAKGMGLDGRIGTKFLHPGPGFGGSCFPKDAQAISNLARHKGYDFEIIDAVLRVNARQQKLMVEKITRMIGDLKGKTLGILGLAFKPNTDDLRESPAIAIVKALLGSGAKIRAYDPAAMEEAKKVLSSASGGPGGGVTFCQDAYDTAKGCDGLILATEWNQFRNLDLNRIKEALKQPVFIDLRNVYEPTRMAELGFRYVGVGRKRL